MDAKPLTGLRVLELGQVYNGPYCGLLLATQGAEVIKIEPPEGEIVRRRAISPGGASYSFLMLNAGKKGITLDLRIARGRELFLGLVEHADVVIENFSHGVMSGLGLGYDALAERNPRVILGSGRGYRSGSDYAGFSAMDLTVQAMSGHMSITGFPGEPPVKAGATLCDMLGSSHLFAAILLALRERDRSGRGRPVEVAMLDATFPALMSYSSPYLEKGFDAGRTGNRHSVPGSSPSGTYRSTDGWVAIMCVTDAHWDRFCEVVGHPPLGTVEELRAGPTRAVQRDAIDAWVNQWTGTQSREQVVTRLAGAGVPCAPVRSLGEAVDDPYNEEQGILRRVGMPAWGEVRVLGSPIQLRDPDATERADRSQQTTPPPKLGEHNREVYGGLLGLDDQALAELSAARVI